MSEYRYQFFRGDKLLGVVSHTEDDQPFHIGSFVPTADFEEVRPLFELEVAELHNCDRKNGRWSEAWGKVSAPGLRLVSEQTGQLRWGGDQLLLIHIDGVKVWWRG